MLDSMENESAEDPLKRTLKRMKEDKRKALKLLRKPIDPRDPSLPGNWRIDSDPPPQGFAHDTSAELYRPHQEAS